MADETVQQSTGEENKVSAVFASFQEYFKTENEIREEIRVAVRELEQTAREALTVLQGIHQSSSQGFKEISKRGRELFGVAKQRYAELMKTVPPGQYYRFCDHWRFANQRFAFLGALIVYIESERLITREELSTMLQVQVKREDGFHIELDDFLMGLLQLAGELSRLAVNCVTSGDYGRPVRIAGFMAELDSGFRLLQLKNDSLRKKFDGLKYDLKKVEEVVYDLSIRGLKPAEKDS